MYYRYLLGSTGIGQSMILSFRVQKGQRCYEIHNLIKEVHNSLFCKWINKSKTKSEKNIILPILVTSLVLFCAGLLFAYYVLIPAALNFFIGYSSTVIEPLWSFDQYFDFILFLFYSTGFSFQVPIVQVILGLAGIVNGKQMLNAWKYVVLGATIISAVLTPSTDPVTQLCLSGAIVILYLIGAGLLVLYKK